LRDTGRPEERVAPEKPVAFHLGRSGSGIHFPVNFQHLPEMDDQVTRESLSAIEHDPKLNLAEREVPASG